MNPALSYIYGRLSEPSTWRGITALVTAAAVATCPTTWRMRAQTPQAPGSCRSN